LEVEKKVTDLYAYNSKTQQFYPFYGITKTNLTRLLGM